MEPSTSRPYLTQPNPVSVLDLEGISRSDYRTGIRAESAIESTELMILLNQWPGLPYWSPVTSTMTRITPSGASHAAYSTTGSDDRYQATGQALEKYDFLLETTLRNLKTFPDTIEKSAISGEAILPQVVELAEQFLRRFCRSVYKSGLIWKAPHIGTDGEGEITLQWWRPQRSLVVFVEPSGSIQYLKVWGPHIWNEMEEDTDVSPNRLVDLWGWLYS